jgi:hypothetical protein
MVTNDPVKVVYSLNVNTLNIWRRNEVAQCFNVEQSGLTSKKYLDQMIGLITTIITYFTTAVSLLQLRSKDPRTAGTIQTSRCYQTSYLEL